jgi:hypothetical protein
MLRTTSPLSRGEQFEYPAVISDLERDLCCAPGADERVGARRVVRQAYDRVALRGEYGLSADSVTYLNADVKGYVDELRAADEEFDAGMRELENDTNFMFVFETGGLMGSPGMLRDPVSPQGRLNPGDVQTNLPIVSLTFDWFHIPALNAGIEERGLSGGPVTRQMVVGHEVYVHAIPFSRSGGRDGCNDQPHSSPDTCGRRRHNELGQRVGWSVRDGW